MLKCTGIRHATGNTMQLLIVGFLCTGFAFLSSDAASRQTVLVVSRADAKRGRGVGVTKIFTWEYSAAG